MFRVPRAETLGCYGRYVESMAAADKLRDSAWWLEILEPYRKLEARFQAASAQGALPGQARPRQAPTGRRSGGCWEAIT